MVNNSTRQKQIGAKLKEKDLDKMLQQLKRQNKIDLERVSLLNGFQYMKRS
ncbi:hypothetical protein [Convivina intestini]|uniref:Uncharacterized protein n=1 Tax=Convivina intestini TaxID=1505726 RepID=A0A2U1DEY3_9LACO|nr:hypothetical protein [Convivina intestini]PVY86243.1 hypothetical protein C7384_101158 [Convivina intestini]CAH1851254.1 hypothetical protein R077811_00255 [Convivina intestini]SDB81804.1 hypothetical protein SAMN05216341_101150 [Leuconostocaceae bacterium R-53105]